MSIESEFQIVAEMICQEDYPAVRQMMDDTVELDFESFSEKYADWVEYVLNHPDNTVGLVEWSEWVFRQLQPEIYFWTFAEKNGRYYLDNENGADKIVERIENLLAEHWNKQWKWSVEEFERQIELSRLKSWEYRRVLNKAIDRSLQRIGFRLVFCEPFGIDGYTVLPSAMFERIDRLRWQGTQIYGTDFRSPTGCLGILLWPLIKHESRYCKQLLKQFD